MVIPTLTTSPSPTRPQEQENTSNSDTHYGEVLVTDDLEEGIEYVACEGLESSRENSKADSKEREKPQKQFLIIKSSATSNPSLNAPDEMAMPEKRSQLDDFKVVHKPTIKPFGNQKPTISRRHLQALGLKNTKPFRNPIIEPITSATTPPTSTTTSQKHHSIP